MGKRWRIALRITIGLPVAIVVFALLLFGGLPVVIIAIAAGCVWGILVALKHMATQQGPPQ